ncbi:hypothetical protein J3454_14420 [Erythrobacter sp. NFXS35]|uniref:hypothetical protein n=1 Tax=Erythrobacter sp. NFXS35 TaxID=2818436 RepID=UPI0032DF5642
MANALLFRPLDWATITASNTASGFAASNLAPHPVPRMGRIWRSSTGSATRSLTIDLGSDQPLDTIALFGIASAGGAPGAGWTWSIDLATAAQGAFSGAFWAGSSATLLAGTVRPVSGKGKALWLAPDGAPAAARYVRINFANLASAAIDVALAAIGQRFQPERNYAYGAAFGVRDLGTLDYSPRGVVLRRPGAKLRGMGLTFRSVHRDEVETTLQRLLERLGNTDPVVLISDPDAHPQRENRMGIGHLTGNLGTVHRVPGFFQSEINFVAVD